MSGIGRCRRGPVFCWPEPGAGTPADDQKQGISALWQREKVFEKTFQKPLDITKMKWYIVITLKKG